MTSRAISKEELNAKGEKIIDKLLAEKRFDEAGSVAVMLAFNNLKTEEVIKLLLDAVREYKKRKGVT